MIPHFRKPDSIDYVDIDDDLINEFAQIRISNANKRSTSSERFQDIFEFHEDAVNSAIETQFEYGLPGPEGIKKSQRGQGSVPRIRWRSLAPPIIKQGSDNQTRASTDLNRLERRWYTQLKRLQDIKAQSKSVGHSDLKWLQIQKVWDKILSAPGFDPNFSSWWDNANHSHAHFKLPISPPCSWEIELIVEDFSFQLEMAGTVIKSGTNTIRQAAHEEDPNLVFKILAEPRVPAPSVISYITTYLVTSSIDEGFQILPELSEFPTIHSQGLPHQAEKTFPPEDGFWKIYDHQNPPLGTEVHEQDSRQTSKIA